MELLATRPFRGRRGRLGRRLRVDTRPGAKPHALGRLAKGLERIVLGTKGGPRVGPGRCNPGYVFLVDGVPCPVDCVPRVTGRLAAAGVPPRSIRKIFVTRHRNDRDIEYGNVANLA